MINRQDQILYYLYRFRFLTRLQLQQFLNHKSFNRIIVWLNELTENNYIRRYYNPKMVTVPAIYSLGTKGRTYLQNNPQFKDIKNNLLDRVWKEHRYSDQFKKHCVFIAHLYLSLLELTQKTNAKLNFRTKTDLYGVNKLISPAPDSYFTIEEKDGKIKRYFLDLFDDFPAEAALKKRVKEYLEYYEEEIWQNKTNTPFPNIILIAPDTRFKNYLNRYILKMLNDEPEPAFYLCTSQDIRQYGITRQVLQKVD